MVSRHSLALALSLLVAAPPVALAGARSGSPEVKGGSYPEIVRLSLVEGDVRVARGKGTEKATNGGDWGAARADLPLLTGFSLATGTGRAEIELEDASTLYLGEDSLLLLDQLETVDGSPRTAITLVSGTATLHVHPVIAGESFTLSTPAGRISVPVGSTSYLRINSFVDAMQVTPQENASLVVDRGETDAAARGKVFTYTADGKVTEAKPTADATYSVWDAWTAQRVHDRSVALDAVMKEAKLTVPLPGIADLYGKGHFFDCAPYGTCWQPNQSAAAAKRARWNRGSTRPHLLRVGQYYGQGYSPYGTGYAPGDLLWGDDLPFPCLGGAGFLFGGGAYGFGPFYDSLGANALFSNWGACHAGSWIHQNHRYAWVVGSSRQGLLPVRWLQYGGVKGFVPMHPSDEPGKVPLNLAYGVFALKGGKGTAIERLSYDPATPVKALDAAPKEFRSSVPPTLARAEAPQLLAHALRPESGVARTAGTPIIFDHRTGSFAVTREETAAAHSGAVTQHFGGMATDRASSGAYRGGAAASAGSLGRSGNMSSSAASAPSGMHGGPSGGSAAGGGGHK